MTPNEVLDQLLAADGGEWFLVKTSTGRAEITASPDGEAVVGKIECHQPEKSSSDASTTTAQTPLGVKSSPEFELPVSSSR